MIQDFDAGTVSSWSAILSSYQEQTDAFLVPFGVMQELEVDDGSEYVPWADYGEEN